MLATLWSMIIRVKILPTHDITKQIEFGSNQLLSELVGPQDAYLIRIEQRLGVEIAVRGNFMAVKGNQADVEVAIASLQHLYDLLRRHQIVDMHAVDSSIHYVTTKDYKASTPNTISQTPSNNFAQDKHGGLSIQTKRRIIFPRTKTQEEYIEALLQNELVFGIGPAGTGKTYLAVAAGVSMLLSGKVDKIILSRPAVEAGERLGFLPGDMREKVDPYLRPLYDALNDMLPAEQVVKRIASAEIEIAPLAFMRGRTLANAFVILDEAQNTTSMQMKMFLTRLGANARMVINGDLTQIDLPHGVQSGLKEADRVLRGVDGLSFVRFSEDDVVRHPLVSKIVKAYERANTTN